MLTRLKRNSGYVGMGCVWWDGRLDHRPCKGTITAVKCISVWRDNGHRCTVRSDELVFTVRLHCRSKTVEAKLYELFGNFVQLYKGILDYASIGVLSKIDNYYPDDNRYVRDQLEKKAEALYNDVCKICRTNQEYTTAAVKKAVMEVCKDTVKTIDDLSLDVSLYYMRNCTLFGFLCDMHRRYPGMDARRRNMVSETIRRIEDMANDKAE